MKKSIFLKAICIALLGAYSLIAQPCKTADDYTYYSRGPGEKLLKQGQIYNFIVSQTDITSIYDVGCNNGLMSKGFLGKGYDVLGIDASQNLSIPQNYPFKNVDVTQQDFVHCADVTLFLSVYHHLLYSVGRSFASTLFYSLLLRSNYLIFDSGNPSEAYRQDHTWMKEMKKYVSTEKELLESFGLPYEVIGLWPTGGGSRSLAVYRRQMFDEHVKKVNQFKLLLASKGEEYGLIELDNDHVTSIKMGDITYAFDPDTTYYKLQLGSSFFLAQKNKGSIDKASLISRLNTRSVNNNTLAFIGFSDRYGIIYEWRDGYEVSVKTIQETNSTFTLLNQLLP